jgi:uncharacterized DUF497 family protein
MGLGQTPNGKILVVVHTFRKIDDMEVIRIISSRKATRKEAKEYLDISYKIRAASTE